MGRISPLRSREDPDHKPPRQAAIYSKIQDPVSYGSCTLVFRTLVRVFLFHSAFIAIASQPLSLNLTFYLNWANVYLEVILY